MSYWLEHKQECIEEARLTLECFFDISLSLSDRMFLRRYVIEFIDELESKIIEHRLVFNPIYEAVGKFLMIHYNFRDINKIARGCDGYKSNAVNRILHEEKNSLENL